MLQTDKTVKKISLAVQAGDSPGTYNYTKEPAALEFIYGIESAGLTPFELAIDSLAPGESTTLTVGGNELESFFGSLFIPLCKAIGLKLFPVSLTVEVEVTDCGEATPREIVAAMAQSVGHGGGCGGGDCGCGCSVGSPKNNAAPLTFLRQRSLTLIGLASIRVSRPVRFFMRVSNEWSK